MQSNRSTLYVFIVLTILVSLVYLNSLGNSFVSDDNGLVDEGKRLLDPNYLLADPAYFLGRIIKSFLYQIGGTNPTIHRTANLILHIGNSFLIFLIVKKMIDFKSAFLTAAIFSIHPFFSEVVVWISARDYALHTFFFLVSFYFYLQKPTKRNYLLTILFFTLSLLSFNRAFVLSLVFPLYDFVFGTRKQNGRVDWSRSVPLLALGIMWILPLLSPLQDRIQTIQTLGNIDQHTYVPWRVIPFIIFTYFKLLIWPQDLSFYHTNLSDNFLIEGIKILSVIFLIVILLISYFRSRLVFFWLCFFVISISLYFLPLPIALLAAERYAYTGAIGLVALFGIGTIKILDQTTRSRLVHILLVLLVIALGQRTIIRTYDWKDEETLILATVKTDPNNPTLHNLAGVIYQWRDQPQKAKEAFHRSILLDPKIEKPYFNLGLTYQAEGNHEEAILFFTKAVNVQANLLPAYQRRAFSFLSLKDYVNASIDIDKAFTLEPKSPQNFLLQGHLLLGTNRIEEAKNAFQEALKLDPQLTEAQLKLQELEPNGN